MPKPTIDAGSLDKRVTLLAPIYNEFQDEIVDWNPVATVWAFVDPNFAQELNEAARNVETVLVPIIIRYRSDVDARWRVKDREKLYEVKGRADFERRHVKLQLFCEEVL